MEEKVRYEEITPRAAAEELLNQGTKILQVSKQSATEGCCRRAGSLTARAGSNLSSELWWFVWIKMD